MKRQFKTLRSAGSVMAALGLLAGTPSHAALFFWDDGGLGNDYTTPGNWSPDGVPGAADLAVHNTGLAPVQITSNVSVDSLRLSNGGAVNHTAGTLTIVNGVGPDNGLWVGEFGPGPTAYTLNGGTVQINDPVDGFMVGRAGGSIATFNLTSGTVNNTVGDTHIGLDGTATWNQSGGVFNGAGVQIGRFQSPEATVNLSGNAVWNVGLVLLSDGFLGSAVRSDLNIIGSGVTISTTGLILKDLANLTFDGTGGGLSTINLNGGQFLLNNGDLFLNNLPEASFVGETITLLENIGSFTGLDTQFDNALHGSVYGNWELNYFGDKIQLVAITAVPEPSSLALLGIGSLALFALRKRRADRASII